jgi:type IV pilus assembly protein PilX
MMTRYRRAAQHRQASPQRGMVLITSLLLLLVVTILAVAMFRSFGLDEKIAGNMRDKQRAISAAETAQQFAESWLEAGNGATATTCAAGISATIQACTTALANFSSVPWSTGVTYTPPSPAPAMPLATTSTSGGQGNYSQAPVFYITLLNTTLTPQASYYQVDAVGYGGSADTVAVVESIYVVSNNANQCASCNQ